MYRVQPILHFRPNKHTTHTKIPAGSNTLYRGWVKDVSSIKTERPRRAGDGSDGEGGSPASFKNNAAATISAKWVPFIACIPCLRGTPCTCCDRRAGCVHSFAVNFKMHTPLS